MPFGSVTLVPGVNVERTPTLLRAGISASTQIRFRDDLVQKLGGWQRYYAFQVPGTPRDLHAWQDLNNRQHLSVGTTTTLGVITNGVFTDISPQTFTTNTPPNISTTAGSNIVKIIDSGVSNPTVYDSVYFNVPVSIGGLILDGLYPIIEVDNSTTYKIQVGANATTTTSNPTATNGATAGGNSTLHFATTPTWLQNGMLIYDVTSPSVIPGNTTVSSSTPTTVVMSNAAVAGGVGNGDNIVFASVPIFTTTVGTSEVEVNFLNHGLAAGDAVIFPVATSVGGITIQGSYDVLSIVDANNFNIQASSAATGSATVVENGGNMQLAYSITIGPLPPAFGYGTGAYGAGAYGTGASAGSAQTGSKISAVDWTEDNWGEILLACPKNQGIYYWDPEGGFTNATIVSSAPPLNSGIFVSTTEQILLAYGSSVHQEIGWQQQPMLVQWSDVGNFFQWQATAATQAGNFTIPIGSQIMAGMAVSNQNLFWTDLDLWAANYIGPPDVFGFNKIGAGLGAVSAHAVQQLRGSVYWMSRANFCNYTSSGANVIPCPVWDAVFQNLNTNFLQNVRSLPNTPNNEVGWAFPSINSSSGECDSYVKFNITEPGAPWDYSIGGVGFCQMPRAAWIDQSVLGMPIGASPSGFIYQHETSPDADGSPLVSAFVTGYFYLAEGEDFVMVDQVIPDFKWTTFNSGPSAQISLSFNLADYPGDIARTYGPFTVNSSTEFIWLRQRARLMSITVATSDLGSFWRLGSIKYRYAPAGRR